MVHSHAMSPETDLMKAFVEAVNQNEPVALLNVVRSQAEGAPPESSKMVLWEDGRVAGSFGKEWDEQVLPDARAALARGESHSFIYPKIAVRTRRAEQAASFEVYVEVVRP